ncbi:ATP-binding protein [Candidatus Pacearchaeota archaeon]|nr:ATP-binding protein [Candidatus Pacearchaeota archaeon]
MEEKLFKRRVVDEIMNFLKSKEIIVIYGARQVGKTSLLRYLIEHHIKKNVFYMDLEIPNLLDLCNQGAESVSKYIIEKGADEKQKIFLIIDEIQYMDDPTKFLKIMHDHYSQIKVIVSGSSTFEIRKKFKESLVGRTVNFEVYPLSFEEFLIFKNKNYKLSKENTSAMNNELIEMAEEYVRFGGYPKIVLESSEEKKQIYLSQIISNYVRKDIRDIGNIRNISSFNKLLEILASQSGQLLNVLELSNTLKINRETITEYLDLLENTFIIKRINPYHKNLRSELSKNPKIFFLDTGMMHLLWLKEFPKVIHGNALETFVFLELVKLNKKINFWRTTNKQEVDFIVKNKELYAIEVKSNFQNADNRSLKFFSEQYKCKTAVIGLKGEKNGKYIWELVKEIE